MDGSGRIRTCDRLIVVRAHQRRAGGGCDWQA
jgi:hypothetical protein